MTFADDQIVYRDLAGAWGSYRLTVDGHDVTNFRGVPAQIGGYQLQEPYGYGPAEFSFPQITSLEVDAWGTGDLAWFEMGKRVRLVQVDENGNRVRVVWRGFISIMNPTGDGTNVHCDGDASGRLAKRDKHPELFNWTKDIGRLIYDNFRKANLPMRPQLGIATGIEVDERGHSGGTFLSYCDGLLAECMTAAGDQLTVMPDDDGVYRQQWKDRTTVHATAFNGAAGVDIDVSRDLQEEPTTFYGSGRTPDGMLWVNGKYPGLVQGDPPAFPGNLSLGDSGTNVEILQAKLIGMGYLEREDAIGGFDDETEEAVKDLQDDAGLPQTGVVNSDTWDALFDLTDTGFSLRHAWVAPLAQLSAVRRNRYTSNGSVAGRNPNHDPTRIEVDRTIEGYRRKRRARQWSKRELARVQNGKNWTGTLTLGTDVAVGDHTHGTAPTQMSRLDLTAGMNIKVRNFDGATKFHISGVNVDSDQTVRLAIDTKARDLLTLGQIIERNRESRQNLARNWMQERRRQGANEQIVEFSEVGGRVYNTIVCPADTWTVFPVVAGQSGSINRIRIQVTDSVCEFATAGTAKRTSRAWWNHKIPNPFVDKAWQNSRLWDEIDSQRALLWAHGDEAQPPGYAPGQKTDDYNEPTGDPITGLFVDDAGVDYWTFDQPVIWVAVYPKQACKIKPQRVLWPVLEAGM